MLYEQALKHDPGAVVLLFRAFNRWLAEDWGMAYADRIFAAPYITLADVDEAVAELEWALDQDARSVVMRAAAPTTGERPALAGCRRVRPVLGPCQRGRHHRRRPRGRRRAVLQRLCRRRVLGLLPAGGGARPSIKLFAIERAAHDFLATLVLEKLFDRFPNVRIASVENGSDFLAPLFRKLRTTTRRMPGYFPRTPSSPSAATCGSTRSGRTTWTRSSTSWGTTGSSSAPTGPTSRACPSPRTG